MEEEKVPNCSSFSSLQAFESYYTRVFFSSEEKLRKITGCLLPCSYTHYSLSDTYSFARNNGTEFVLTYALTDHLIEEEVLLFPLDSLVSELGGALGLFLGFSFLGAVDTMQTWAKTFLAKFRKRLQREAA